MATSFTDISRYPPLPTAPPESDVLEGVVVVTTQPYAAPAQQVAVISNPWIQVITDQPRKRHVQTFLEQVQNNNRIHLRARKPCFDCGCLRWCNRRKVYIKSMDAKHFGYAVNPCTECSFDDWINIRNPNKDYIMQTVYECKLWETLLPCLFIFNDLVIMDIYGTDGQKLGSFEYSPRFCRWEPYCWPCRGKYVIKNEVGARMMHLPPKPCCCPWMISVPTVWCGRIPLVIFSENDAVFPVCQKWLLPIETRSSVDGRLMSRLRMVNKTFFQECCCCAPVQYVLDVTKENETEENRLLILGASFVIDYYRLPYHIFNDSNFNFPEEFEQYDF